MIAFDTGPGNMIVDALVRHFTHGRRTYDRDARLAQRGRLLPALLDKLLADPYLRRSPPKTQAANNTANPICTSALAGAAAIAKPKT